MATLEQLAQALVKAEKAGNVGDAKVLSTAYREKKQEAPRRKSLSPYIKRDTGQGRLSSFGSNVARGIASPVPGVLGGVGYLTGSDTLVDAANTVEGKINKVLPVNPLYEDEFVQKAGNAAGQAVTMLGTAGVGGAVGKALGGVRGLTRGAELASLATGGAQGARGGGQRAEQYGMQGANAYLSTLSGLGTSLLTEKIPFGLAAETGLAQKLLGEGIDAGLGRLAKSTGTEALEEMADNTLSNTATKFLAPEGVETPGILEGNLEAGALGAVGGATMGGLTALAPAGQTVESPTVEGDAMIPYVAPEDLEENVSDLRLEDVVVQKAVNAVEQNADVLLATAAAIADLKTPEVEEVVEEPVVEETVVEEAPPPELIDEQPIPVVEEVEAAPTQEIALEETPIVEEELPVITPEEAEVPADMQPAIDRNRAQLEQAAATLRGEGPKLPESAKKVFGGSEKLPEEVAEPELVDEAPQVTETLPDAANVEEGSQGIPSKPEEGSISPVTEEKVTPTPQVSRAKQKPESGAKVMFKREGKLETGTYEGQDSSGRHIINVDGRREYSASMPVQTEGPDVSISFSEEPAAPPVKAASRAASSPALDRLQVNNETLSPAAKSKWTPEAYAKAERFYASKKSADLEGLSTVQKTRIRQAALEVDEAARLEQEALDRKEEGRIAKQEKKDREFASRSTYLSASEPAAARATQEELNTVAAEFGKLLPGLPPVQVVTPEQLATDPNFSQVKGAAEAVGSSLDRVEGGVNPQTQTVFLVANQIRDPQRAREVLVHELIGHVGIEAVATEAEMQRIADVVQRVAPDIVENVERNYPAADARTRASEILARFSEQYRSADPAELKTGWRKAWDEIKRIVKAIIKRLGGDPNAFDDVELHSIYSAAARRMANARAPARTTPTVNRAALSVEDQNVVNQANFPGTEEARAAYEEGLTVKTRARYQAYDEKNNHFLGVTEKEMLADVDAFLDSRPLTQAFDEIMSEKLPAPMKMGGDGRYSVLVAGLLRRLNTAEDATKDPYEVAQIRQMQLQAAQRFMAAGTSAGRNLGARGLANAQLNPIAPVLATEKILLGRVDSRNEGRFEGGTGGVVAKVEKISQTAGSEASTNVGEGLEAADTDSEISEAEDLRNKGQQAAEKVLQTLIRPNEEAKGKVHPVRQVFNEHLEKPMPREEFTAKMTSLGVDPTLADTLFTSAQDMIRGRELTQELRAKEAQKKLIAKDSPKLAEMLNTLRKKLYPGLKWREIFMDLPGNQRDRQVEIFTRLRLDERLQGLSQQEAIDLTNELDKAWQRERRKVFLRELKKAGALGEKKASDKAKVENVLPQLLRQLNLGVFNSETFRTIIAPEYGMRPLTSEEAKEMRKLAEEAWQLPEGIRRNKKLGEILNRMQKATGSSRVELLNNYWTASVLSGLATHYDTFMAFLNGMGTNLIQAGTLMARGDPKNAYGAHLQWWSGLLDGFQEVIPLVISKPGEADYSLLKNFGKDLNRMMEGESHFRPVPLGENLWKNGNVWQKYAMSPVMMFVGRSMAAADHINNTATTYGAMAVARALNPEMYENAGAFTTQEIATARKQAIEEITGGEAPTTKADKQAVSVRTREILGQLLAPEDFESASAVGDTAAFQGDPTGLFGTVYKGFAGLFRAGESKLEDMSEDEYHGALTRAALAVAAGGLRGLLGAKFMRFGFNFGEDLTQYIPGTYLAQGLLYDKDMPRMQRDLLLGKNIFGLMAAMTLTALFMGDGEDEEETMWIDGNWADKTPEEARAARSAGREPFSIGWRNADGSTTKISYRQWPTSGIFVAVGAMADQRRDDPAKWKETGPGGHLIRAVTTGALQVKDVSAMRGLAEVFGAASRSASPEETTQQLLLKMPLQYAGGFVPNLLKDLDTWNDPRNFKPETLLDELVRSVPIMRKEAAGGRPMLNLLGEEVKLVRTPWRRMYSESPAGKGYEVLGSLLSRGLGLPEPSDKRVVRYKGEDVTIGAIGPEAYWNFARILGGKYKVFLEANGDRLKEMDTKRAQKFLRSRANDMGDQAEKELVRYLNETNP